MDMPSSKDSARASFNKRAALAKELKRRKQQADTDKKRRAGESESDYKKRLKTTTYGNPNE